MTMNTSGNDRHYIAIMMADVYPVMVTIFHHDGEK